MGGEWRTSLEQRTQSLIVSQKFPSSTPYRSVPMLVQFGHFFGPGELGTVDQ